MIYFCILLLIHLMYDFHWQGAFIAEMKAKSSFILFVHCLTYTLFIGVAMYYMNLLEWWTMPFLLFSHYFVDNWKCKLPKEKQGMQALYVDQFCHFIILVIVYFGGRL